MNKIKNERIQFYYIIF